MGAFKHFLTENEDLLSQIHDMLDELSAEEISEFGDYLTDEFLEIHDEDEEEAEEQFDIDDVKSISFPSEREQY